MPVTTISANRYAEDSNGMVWISMKRSWTMAESRRRVGVGATRYTIIHYVFVDLWETNSKERSGQPYMYIIRRNLPVFKLFGSLVRE